MAYHSKITSQFGVDLFRVLGPKSQRVRWHTLSPQEQKRRINRIPIYVSTRQLGSRPRLIDIVSHCFHQLANMGVDNPLLGIDLPELESLVQASELQGVPPLQYSSKTLHAVDQLYKNAAKQREVFLRHIFKDIVFRFNPSLVFSGLGRKNKRGQLFVNDGQHRALACIILGIEHIPVDFIKSDDEYWDVAQYAAINIDGLSASEFDRYRIRVQRRITAVEGGYPTEPDDDICFELHELFDNLGIKVLEKGDTRDGNSLVLTSIGNMIKYRETYPQQHFSRAVTLNAQMFPTSKFHTANSWGLMEFLKYQSTTIDPMVLDYAIMRAVKTRWPKDNAGGSLNREMKTAYRAQSGVSALASRAPESLIVAHGIWQVCCRYAPDIAWREPKWDVKRHGPKYVFKMV